MYHHVYSVCSVLYVFLIDRNEGSRRLLSVIILLLLLLCSCYYYSYHLSIERCCQPSSGSAGQANGDAAALVWELHCTAAGPSLGRRSHNARRLRWQIAGPPRKETPHPSLIVAAATRPAAAVSGSLLAATRWLASGDLLPQRIQFQRVSYFYEVNMSWLTSPRSAAAVV